MIGLKITTENTVTISTDLLMDLRAIAKGRGISISSLCAKILKAGIKRESSTEPVDSPTTIVLREGMGDYTSVSVAMGVDIWKCTEQTSRRRLESLVARGVMAKWKDHAVPNRHMFCWAVEAPDIELDENGMPSLETMLAAPVMGESEAEAMPDEPKPDFKSKIHEVQF
jgi:hypothetical protein